MHGLKPKLKENEMVHVEAKVTEENGRIVVHVPVGDDYEALSRAEKERVIDVLSSIASGEFDKGIVERALSFGSLYISVPKDGKEVIAC